MKETGLTFADYSMRAILAGNKTQSRRLAKGMAGGGFRHRFGGAGDRIWCREAWRTEELKGTHVDGIRYRAGGEFVPIRDTREAADRWIEAYDNGKYENAWRTPMYMRRWMARAVLELVEEVRLERLHDITDDDAAAEGVDWVSMADVPRTAVWSKRQDFAQLWDKIHGRAAPWESNPLVWRLSFKKLDQPGG